MSGLLIAGTTSDAGKSLVVAGICRWLARNGYRVAPFKAQNMSNNSMVCGDGAEIGRAQWLQARAARVEPETAMNPVLLKPGSDRRSHIVAMGAPYGVLDAGEYASGRAPLATLAFDALAGLRRRFDLVVCEGAGSPAEVNLRSGDYVNMGLARQAGLPVLVVGDIDRGGVLASMFGTVALLSAADQALLAGWVVNKFRGDPELLRPGLDSLATVTGRPVLGVVPFLEGVWIDSEDALAAEGWRRDAAWHQNRASMRVTVVRLPRTSNATDVDAFAAEPGVRVEVTADPEAVFASDIAVLPGSRATVDDLDWLRRNGLASAIQARADAGKPVLGVCGGYQMLARRIVDDVESEVGSVDGLDLLPIEVEFSTDKVLGRPDTQWRGHEVSGYEIHHGHARIASADPRSSAAVSFLDGWQYGSVYGTTWHGAFECDGFRRAWLAEAAAYGGLEWVPDTAAPGFATLREAMLDRLADAIESHLDTDQLLNLAEHGPPTDVPFVPPGL